MNHRRIIELLQSSDFVAISFDETLHNQAKVLRNFMKMFEILLMFIHATREQNWNLYLFSLHKLSQYYFAYDMLNYARLTPVYLSQMFL